MNALRKTGFGAAFSAISAACVANDGQKKSLAPNAP
jgi:hypothetical protein